MMNKKEKVKNKKVKTGEKGITLVSLAVTIIILIILATITINVAFGEGGLIDKAQQTKNLTEQAIEKEQENLNDLRKEYANVMAEDSEISDEPDEPYVDDSIAVAPQISEGMTPVKYINGTGWVKTTENDPEWYNYAENKKQWANIVLGGAKFNTSGSYEVLDENSTYSMLVWIPRYAYKITSKYHQSGSDGGNIEIVFLDTANKDRNGIDYSSKTEYPEVTGEGTASGAMTDYVVHPAFDWDGKALSGFWVGKFESSDNGGKIQIKGGVQSWRSISVNDIHNKCVAMNNSGNSYGLNTDDSKVDPHMMKNSEWGAVAYLAQSKYGKHMADIEINDSSSYYTGGGSGTSYRTNIAQSTTGNVTGIYDMSGGAWEYVAGYYGSGNSNGSSLVNAPSRYKDIYSSYTAPTSGGHYGDAVWETSSSSSGANSWYDDYSNFPGSDNPFFLRGGVCSNGSNAGLFYFGGDYGDGSDIISFRIVVPVL